jgi:hypothetical protein
MPVILANWEIEIRRISKPGQCAQGDPETQFQQIAGHSESRMLSHAMSGVRLGDCVSRLTSGKKKKKVCETLSQGEKKKAMACACHLSDHRNHKIGGS